MPTGPVLLAFPFHGRWMARNSPASRVPSHGTHLLGTTYAIDFVGVDARDRPAPRSWRSALSAEPPEIFTGWGRPVLAPVAATVVVAHDGEPDHVARRSQLALVPYALGQAARARGGPAAIAGNHVVLAIDVSGPFVLLAHLRRGTVAVVPGDRVEPGDELGACGNSGNSTQPHVHVQVIDSITWETARGIPVILQRPGRGSEALLPRESQVVDV